MDGENKKKGEEGCGKCEGGVCGGANCASCASGSCGGNCGPASHGCGGCCGSWKFGGHRLLRVLLGLIILIVVFSMGFKLGELRGMFTSAGFGGRGQGGRFLMMRGYDAGEDYFPGGGGMMRGWGAAQVPSATTTIPKN